MKAISLCVLVALVGCTSPFERSVQDHQRRGAALDAASLVVEYHRDSEDPAHPDAAADQRLLDAFMHGCGMNALRRLDASLTREIPYAVLSLTDGRARMAGDAAAFDADVDQCFASLHAHGRVTWLVGARELDAQAMAAEVAVVMSFPEGHTASWAGLGAGCGSRGGPGYRLASGQCASWSD